MGKFLPIITLKSISNTTSTITVEVETKRNQGGILEYYIKSEDDEEYKLGTLPGIVAAIEGTDAETLKDVLNKLCDRIEDMEEE